MSGRFKVALNSVPATKPSCTAIATQLICDGESRHSTVSAGTTAEPLNHSDMPSNSAIESSARARQRRGCGDAIQVSHKGTKGRHRGTKENLGFLCAFVSSLCASV